MNIIYTVIVTYNGMKWIGDCLESLCQSSILSNVIIVDNNSEDNTVGYLKEKFPEAVILPQNQNLGFGKANNLGISYALENGADFVFLFNQDARIDKNSLEKLVGISKQNPEFGIISPFHFDWFGQHLEYYFSKFILENLAIYSDFIINKELKPLYEVPFINAAAWLIPRETFEKVGGFDPIFYHYGEDNNYCQRVFFHKYKIGVVPNTFIFHDSKIRKEPKDYLFTETYFLNEVKQFQIKFADVNLDVSVTDLKKEIKQIRRLILLQTIKLNLKGVQGYIRKLKLFKKNINKITHSRKQNIVEGPHYLNF